MKDERGSGNRLKDSKSPYLLQHADNPVDWYPWGDEAFEKAKREDKPIFLSIGYSTCHWCHVMEHESFEDREVARLLNATFVCIKVDREERPDIDEIYMSVCQMMTGRGGWPLTIIMTPEKQPFFAATYIPRESRYGMTGLLELIPRIRQLWENRRHEVESAAKQITVALSEVKQTTSDQGLNEGMLKAAYEALATRFDKRNGGFGGAPKFPSPTNLAFLLRYWRRYADPKALEMVEKTLRTMRLGGIYDHVGFGFHRYSTDAEWRIPHFEKMLYDQALLLIAYSEAYQATHKPFYAQTAREIATYVLRDLKAPCGGFYSAEDADSEGEEGKFYTWMISELEKPLGKADARRVAKIFNCSEHGNFTEQAGASPRNVLYRGPGENGALGIDEKELAAYIEKVRQKMFAVKALGARPLRDEKILTDWNGLMIVALAKSGAILGESTYIEAARQAASFILDEMVMDDGRLLHRYYDGDKAIDGYIQVLIWRWVQPTRLWLLVGGIPRIHKRY